MHGSRGPWRPRRAGGLHDHPLLPAVRAGSGVAVHVGQILFGQTVLVLRGPTTGARRAEAGQSLMAAISDPTSTIMMLIKART